MQMFCTYFDHRYLSRGLAMYQSLMKFTSDGELWVLTLDHPTQEVLRALDLPRLHLLSLDELESADPELEAARSTRSLIEYYFTCTASLTKHLIQHVSEGELVTYIDADLYFFSAPETIHAELGTGSILLTSHRFPPALSERSIFGKYNVGFLAFRNDRVGRKALEWWRERSIEWCFDRVEDGKFAEQGYLDRLPEMFAETVEVHNPAAAVAPWNWSTDTITLNHGRVFVAGNPMVTYHFHGLRVLRPWLYDLQLKYYPGMPRFLKRRLYGDYAAALRTSSSLINTKASYGATGSPLRYTSQGVRDLISALRWGDLMIVTDRIIF